MKYLCLVYLEEDKLAALSKSEYDTLTNDSLDYADRLQRSGHLIARGALQGVATATTLRHRNGRISATDGPFAETKEQLGGFFLIEAKDLDEALELAAKAPPGRLGCIEVRPVRELPHLNHDAAPDRV